MLRVATPANEALLLDYARLMTASQLEQTCRKYALVLRHGQDPHPLGDLQRRYVRRRDTEDGMVKIEAVLHPEEAEVVWTTLSHAATQLARSPSSDESSSKNVSAETRETPRPAVQAGVLHKRANAARRAFSRADALVALAQGYLRGDRQNHAPIDVTLTIPAAGLCDGGQQPGNGLHPIEVGELGESFVSCEAARRLSCDCGVTEVIEDDTGVPLSVGRKRRTISGRLKRALLERDKTCTFPGCTNHLYLEGHHIKHWADGGETSLSNAALLCTAHHHYVHEYAYTIELDPDQRPRFRDPHGRLVVAVPEPPAVTNLGWPSIRTVNEPLAIHPETNACKWDGNPVDYGAVIDYLVTADGLN